MRCLLNTVLETYLFADLNCVIDQTKIKKHTCSRMNKIGKGKCKWDVLEEYEISCPNVRLTARGLFLEIVFGFQRLLQFFPQRSHR